MTLTQKNKASGLPQSHFVVLWTDGREYWWTPDQAREVVANLSREDEVELGQGLLLAAASADEARAAAGAELAL